MTYPAPEMIEAALSVLCQIGIELPVRGILPDSLIKVFEEDARDAIHAALIAAERAAWRPIEEAPKDGSSYLGVIKNGAVLGEPFVARWDEELGHICEFQTEMLPHIPTHFRPLPLGPEGEV